MGGATERRASLLRLKRIGKIGRRRRHAGLYMRFTRERRPRLARFNDHSLCEKYHFHVRRTRALHTRRPVLKRVGGDRRRAMRNGIYHKLRSKMSLGPWRTRVCTPALPSPPRASHHFPERFSCARFASCAAMATSSSDVDCTRHIVW